MTIDDFGRESSADTGQRLPRVAMLSRCRIRHRGLPVGKGRHVSMVGSYPYALWAVLVAASSQFDA